MLSETVYKPQQMATLLNNLFQRDWIYSTIMFTFLYCWQSPSDLLLSQCNTTEAKAGSAFSDAPPPLPGHKHKKNTDCSKHLAPWRDTPSSVELLCEKFTQNWQPSCQSTVCKYYSRILIFLFKITFYRNGKGTLDKRGTYKCTTPCLFILMAVSPLWTVLFRPLETEMILTLLDNNIPCCSIYLWNTHVALHFSCKDKWDTDNNLVKHVSFKHKSIGLTKYKDATTSPWLIARQIRV